MWSGLSLAAREVNLFQNPDINLKAKNYAAADYIIQQAETFIDSNDVLQVQPLVNFHDPQTPAAIGTVIPEQIGARLTQLGYNIDSALVTADNPAITVKPAPLAKPDFILNGHYLTDRPNMDVSLRITEISTGRTVGVFDYTMATNREIRELAAPAPQIMIIKK